MLWQGRTLLNSFKSLDREDIRIRGVLGLLKTLGREKVMIDKGWVLPIEKVNCKGSQNSLRVKIERYNELETFREQRQKELWGNMGISVASG